MSEPLSISIVVPNFNYGATLEKTLHSLVEQQYPRLEILVVDGGSTDGSLDIVRRYERHLAWWVSEPDRGQSDAINKGLRRTTGEVVNWLCSDDFLMPGALATVAAAFSPDVDVVAGACLEIFEQENRSAVRPAPRPEDLPLLAIRNPVSQPSCFFRRRLLDRPQPVDESLHFAMDFELWNYFASQGARWKFTDEVLSGYLISGTNKSALGSPRVPQELDLIYRRYVKEWIPLTFWQRRILHRLERIRESRPKKVWAKLNEAALLGMRLALAPFYGWRRVKALDWSFFEVG